jgi:hypothetical protein
MILQLYGWALQQKLPADRKERYAEQVNRDSKQCYPYVKPFNLYRLPAKNQQIR